MKNSNSKNSRMVNNQHHSQMKKSSQVMNVNPDELQNYINMLNFQNQ